MNVVAVGAADRVDLAVRPCCRGQTLTWSEHSCSGAPCPFRWIVNVDAIQGIDACLGASGIPAEDINPTIMPEGCGEEGAPWTWHIGQLLPLVRCHPIDLR